MHSVTTFSPDVTADEQELKDWARKLQRWGLARLVSAFMENNSALATLAAQSLYISQPLLETFLPVRSFAQWLEDPKRIGAFVKMLREEQ